MLKKKTAANNNATTEAVGTIQNKISGFIIFSCFLPPPLEESGTFYTPLLVLAIQIVDIALPRIASHCLKNKVTEEMLKTKKEDFLKA